MSHHYRNNSHNHRQVAESTATTSHRNHSPSEIFALIDTERILVTIAPYGWRTYIRRADTNEYGVRFENAAGVVSGELRLDRREARQLVAEKCQEAVWLDLQDRTAWPASDATEGNR